MIGHSYDVITSPKIAVLWRGDPRPVRSRPSMSVLSVPSVRFCNTLREASARYMGHTASVLSVRVCPRPSSVHVRPVCLVRPLRPVFRPRPSRSSRPQTENLKKYDQNVPRLTFPTTL